MPFGYSAYILPALGELRVWEVNTPRLEAFLTATEGVAKRAACKVVLSHMMKYAVRCDALRSNPVSFVQLPMAPEKAPRAHQAAEMEQLLADLDTWVARQNTRASLRRKLADAVEIYLVTGQRTGELLGVLGSEIDLEARTYLVTGTVKRSKEMGLYRQPFTKGKRDRGGVFPWGSIPTVTRLVAEAQTD